MKHYAQKIYKNHKLKNTDKIWKNLDHVFRHKCHSPPKSFDQ